MTPNPLPPQSSSPPDGLRIDPIPAFQDNYIWTLARAGRAIVVDPGDAAPVLRTLRERDLTLDAIVVTHHHADHVGGVAQLLQAWSVPVHGPARTPYDGVTNPLADGDRVSLLGYPFQVLAVPGHTLDHIAYWSPELGVLFCGDTLFAAGCGRLFEGSPAQMHASLSRLAALPPQTRVYCTHEYTLSNLRFARAVEPGNLALQQRQESCIGQRERGEPTLPSTVGVERETNPFLRCAQDSVRAAAQAHAGSAAAPGDAVAVFAAIRSWKDRF
jgi:hydroxyacylglutathione hydrolase